MNMESKTSSLLSTIVLLGFPLVALASTSLFHSPGSLNLINGEWQSKYEKDFDAGLSIHNFAVASLGNIQYRLFAEGKSGVVIGSDGWLFTSEDFATSDNDEAEIADKLSVIKSVQAKLQQQNIKLVVALIPDKSRVYQEYLGRYLRPAKLEARYQTFRKSLQDSNIVAPDILEALSDMKTTTAVFLKADTHWTPAGAKATADVIFKSSAPLVADQPKKQFATSQAAPAIYASDLRKFIPLGWFATEGEKVATAKTTEVNATSDLLGQTTVPITLVGTSYSAIEIWNFAGALEQAFSLNVANQAKEGLGPIPPMMEYLASKDIIVNRPQMVIWEFPERYLNKECVGKCQ
jgi:alginate O-acetyltransferase complex protein AlgJ